jgi:hypothetical protein
MNVVKSLNTAGAVATIALLAACSADPSAPVALRPTSPSLDVTSPPGTAPERSLLICKNTTNTDFPDHFTYSVSVYEDGTGTFVKTISNIDVLAGNCVDAVLGLGANPPSVNYRVNVTEAASANYAVTGVTAQWNPDKSAPTIDIAASPQVTGLYVGHDLGSIVTFTNNYTPPASGCTFTLGYWKTHNASFKGGAAPDPTWNLLPGGLAESTVFFLSGKTWFQTFNTAPAGNAYYVLSQQYMAARLNVLSGASVPAAVGTAIATSTLLFNTYTPAQIGALKGSNALRAQFIALAGTLDSYNTGATGPGHCE